MKNIHMLPTSLPSRLGYLTKKGKEVFKDLRFFDRFMPTIMDGENQNVYITCSSEFEPRKYVLWEDKVYKYKEFMKMKTPVYTDFFYILLTTDLELISDGVQKIDDEFLEWFVNNSSYEFVEVEKTMYMPFDGKVAFELSLDESLNTRPYYKLIIPKEEPKQKNRKVCKCKRAYENPLSGICELCWDEKYPTKQETLEEEYYNDFKMIKGENIIEAAKRFWKESKANPIEMAIFGAEWQEEENKKYIHKLLDIIQWYDNNSDVRPDLEKFEWFEQSKNK